VRPPVPVIEPEKVVVPDVAARVIVPDPKETLPPVVPPPARDWTELELELRSRMAVATSAKETAELEEKDPTAPERRMPALIVVVPL